MHTQSNVHERVCVSLCCLALVAISAPACDGADSDGVDNDNITNVDEQAPLDAELPDTPSSPAMPTFADNVDTPVTPQLPDVLELPHDLAALPDPNSVYIEGIVANGVGCPKDKPGSIVAQISADKKSFIVIFQDMLLSYPPGPPIKATNCVASVKLHVPGGWQVSVATVNTRGYGFLTEGVSARQTSNYFFAGDPVGYSAHSNLVGPYDDFYVFSDEVPFQSLVWSKCGTSAIFAINTSLLLNALANPWGFGIFNNTDIDGTFRKEFQWQWKPC